MTDSLNHAQGPQRDPAAGLEDVSAWFAGPKAENAAWFSDRLRQIIDDYYAWRRNYFPEDGAVIGSSLRRHNEAFQDAFEDRLLELLARLKGDVPFHSPRYAAHMLAEQTLPAIAGYFAAMLYNPNNVTADVAPVTVRLELEAGRMLARMIGFGASSWAHLCSGGTGANLEALWLARTARYLPWVVRDARRGLGLALPGWAASDRAMLALTPDESLALVPTLWADAEAFLGPAGTAGAANAIENSAHNLRRYGLHAVTARIGAAPSLIVPETHHYCLVKILDILGLGQASLLRVPVDRNFRMRIDALGECLTRLDRDGGHALAVVAVAGSTEEGSIDPVDGIVALAKARRAAEKPSFWLHVDGAYGAYLRTVTVPTRCGLGERHTTVKIRGVEHRVPLELPEHGECAALEAMSASDSVTVDPHKLGYIPYPAGAVCYRNNLVKCLARQEAAYIDEGNNGDGTGTAAGSAVGASQRGPQADRESESIGLYVLEGSKPGAAAAAVWLSHSLIPLDTTGHGRLIRENIRNACELYALLDRYHDLGGYPGVRAVSLCPPGSNIVCYAFRPAGGARLAEINAINRELFDRFSLHHGQRVYDQRFFISRTQLSALAYSLATVQDFLTRLGVSGAEYEREGVFLLRSVMMNPWYAHAKARGRSMVCELVEALFAAASETAGGKMAPRSAE